MPAKKSTNRHVETRKLMALAYNDAVRDILHSDGMFHLDDRAGNDVWQWDGSKWDRIPLVDRTGKDEPPFIDVGSDAEVAAAG
ncbi:MAG: hypothetical protein JWN44_6918 [Myxococcales bacterium]|nr:hypothetical protein [Myxococcales bacterium]